MRFVVDAHALVWFITGDERLGSQARVILSDPDSEIIVPTIVLAEACWVAEHGKVAGHSSRMVFEIVSADNRVRFFPMTDRVVLETLALVPIGEMHDRQIVATTILAGDAKDTTLVTRDRNIVSSGLVATVW